MLGAPSNLHGDEADSQNAKLVAALTLTPNSDDGVISRYFCAGIFIKMCPRAEHLEPVSLLLELNLGDIKFSVMIDSDS